MSRRDTLVLKVFAGWTLFIWVTRMWNILRDSEHGTAFKLVHLVLASVSVGLALAAWSIVTRNRKRETAGSRS